MSAKSELAVRGMTCGNCARHVAEALEGVPGVDRATVTLDPERATVRWKEAPNLPALLRAVEEAGYHAEPLEAPADPSSVPGGHRLAGWQAALWVSVLGTAPLMLGEWAFGWSMEHWFQWLAFGLSTVVQFYAGAKFYRGAWNQLKIGSSNMDTLVALGSTTAYVYSAWAFFAGWGGHLYFMEAAAIISLVSVGHWLEARVSAQAASSLRALLDLAPAVARRRENDGTDREVPVAALKAKDLVVLKPGDRVPIDGTVIEGEAAVDESMLTGESIPADKSAGSPLYAGTMNLNGRLILRVTATGEETALAHIIAAVERAQNSRASIQRLGDQVSSVFVPIVVCVAVATALWRGLAFDQAQRVGHWLAAYLWTPHLPSTPLAAAFIGAAAVLIIACPCAMGLATPVAIMAGSNTAAKRGILIRDGAALEKAGEVTAVLFDKTGTLTAGKPLVVKVQSFARAGPTGLDRLEVRHLREDGPSEGRSLQNVTAPTIGTMPANSTEVEMAAALARHSTHPLSEAVARLAAAEVTFSDWQEVGGAGVQGRREDRLWRLGSLRWLEECHIDLTQARSFASEWSAQGSTILGLAGDQSLFALFAVQDTLKAGARDVIQKLHRKKLKTYLVTGDNRLTAESIARQAGVPVENVFAEVRPEQKAGLVRQLQAQGEHVAFVGDGINDAPALEQADLGIAVSRASDIARAAADIILLKSGIDAVPESLGLAQATLRTIQQNLFWAFFYNALGIPLAALGFMSPVLCAAAMGLSDLVVIGNALRLLRWRR